MNGKMYRKVNQKQKSKNKISLFLLLIFITIMIFSGIKIIKWLKENKESNSIIEEIGNAVSIDESIETVDKYNVDFKSLKQKNSDTVAWIKINGTNIEYPVVKANDNDYYLVHNFSKRNNSGGWVFMDYKNKVDGTDKNIVIYAHNRKDGSMFGTLKNILKKEWQNNSENYIIPFITENGKEEFYVSANPEDFVKNARLFYEVKSLPVIF